MSSSSSRRLRLPRIARCLGALLLLACAAPPAAVAAPTWLAPVNVSDPVGSAFPFDVDADAAGDILLTWRRHDGVYNRIQVADRPAGAAFGAPVTLSAEGQNADEPRADLNAQGDAVVAWSRFDGSSWRIQATVRPAGGEFEPAQTLSVLGQDAYEPVVAIDAAGDAAVAWRRETGSGFVVEGATRPAGAAAFGPASVLSAAGHSVFHVKIAANPAGDLVLAWDQEDPGGSRIWAATGSASGGFGSAQAISAAGATAGDARIGIDAEGEAQVVWTQLEGIASAVKWAVRAPGGGFGAPVQISPAGASASSPSLAVDQAGDAAAAWVRLGPDPNWRVESALRPAGGAFGAGQLLSAPGEDAQKPGVAVDADGAAVSVWERSDGSHWLVEAAARPAGGAYGPAKTVSAAGQDAREPKVTMDPEGNAAATWSRFDGADYRVQAAGFDAVGPTLSGLALPREGAIGELLPFSVTPRDTWTTASVSWSFGDGTSARGDSVGHAYGAAGPHTATVLATDAVGNSTTAGGVVSVSPNPPAEVLAPPPPRREGHPRLLSRASLSPRRFAVRRKGHGGAILRFRLSAPARVAIVVERGRPGRRDDREGKARCVKPTARLRHHRRCVRFGFMGLLSNALRPAGRVLIPVSGRLGGRPMPAGRYRLRLRPRSADGRSQLPTYRPFTIVPPR